ncbi:MAG: hypothetical protein KJ018_12940, partial [Burkholderiales bacterium]|nr:hypothetical protein [Burkholderiales bacterium]
MGATATMAAPADFDPAFGSGGLAAPPYAYSVAGALQPDGALALIVRGRDYYDGSSRIVRVDAHGHLDPAFVIAPTPALPLVDLVGLPDGRLVAMQSVYLIMGFCDTKVLRFLPDGSPDPSFRVAETSACASTLGVSPAGNIFTSYSNWSRVDGSSWSAVLQIGSAGPPIVPRGLQTAGPGGTLSWTYGRVAVTADGEPVAAVALPTPALGVVRLLGEIPDPAFGSAGLASIATLAPVTANDVLVASDGSVLVAGRARWQGRSRIVVAKFTRDGRADPSFGNAGLAAIEVARHGEEIASVRIALQHDGKLLLGSDLHS